jgi:hypothetical protein
MGARRSNDPGATVLFSLDSSLINTPPTLSCQAASNRRSGKTEADRIVRYSTIRTHPARAIPRPVLEGSNGEGPELDAIGRGGREEKTAKSTSDNRQQNSPSPTEKGWVSHQALLQIVVLIRRLSRRLQPKAAPAPKIGSAPGTGSWLEGVKTKELEEEG